MISKVSKRRGANSVLVPVPVELPPSPESYFQILYTRRHGALSRSQFRCRKFNSTCNNAVAFHRASWIVFSAMDMTAQGMFIKRKIAEILSNQDPCCRSSSPDLIQRPLSRTYQRRQQRKGRQSPSLLKGVRRWGNGWARNSSSFSVGL